MKYTILIVIMAVAVLLVLAMRYEPKSIPAKEPSGLIWNYSNASVIEPPPEPGARAPVYRTTQPDYPAPASLPYKPFPWEGQ